MIELGRILIRDETSIVEARNKVRLLSEDLKFSSIEATRLATITSELSRIVYQEDGESSIVVGLDKKAERFGLVLMFESKKEVLNIVIAQVFFDKLNTFRTEDGFQRVEVFRYLPDPGFRPTKKFIDIERERLDRLSRAELLSEVKRKNEALQGLYNDLKKARDHLEIRVQERTAELAKSNKQLERELTQRKQAEEALMESEERYRNLFDNANDLIQSVMPDGHFLYTNKSWQKILGYSEEEIRNLTIWNLIHPDSIPHCRESFQKVTAGETVKDIEAVLVAKDGRLVTVEGNCSCRFEGEKPLSIQSFFRDVTEQQKVEDALRESERKYRDFADSLPQTVFEIDEAGNFTFFNLNSLEIFDHALDDSYKGWNVLQMFVPEERDSVKENIQRALSGEALGSNEYTALRKDGSTFPVVLYASPIIEGKKAVGLRGIVVDITERKQMQEQLIVTDRLASVGELAAGIAHELNNPLTSVIGFSDMLLQREDLPDDAKEDLKVVNDEAQRTARVVRNLLTFSRKHTPEKQPVNINDIIQTVLALRAYEQQVNNIKVNTSLAADLLEVTANASHLQQVFINIIINAEHFMTEAHRSGTLTITTERVGDTIRASFADDGPGIAKESLRYLFDPFFTTKEVGKGTGLGLSISYGIITEHGGKIYAESEMGKGATFVVELPISTSDGGGKK